MGDSEFHVSLFKNISGPSRFRLYRTFSSLETASGFIEMIKPNCKSCKLRVDCLTSERCLRLQFIELRSNGTVKNLSPKIVRA